MHQLRPFLLDQFSDIVGDFGDVFRVIPAYGRQGRRLASNARSEAGLEISPDASSFPVRLAEDILPIVDAGGRLSGRYVANGPHCWAT
jgi:hypothetical protein